MKLSKALIATLLALTLCLPCASAAVKPQVQFTEENGPAFSYSLSLPEEEFLLLQYKTPFENGETVIHAENGLFSGTIPLRYSAGGGRFTLTIQDLKLRPVASQTLTMPKAEGFEAPEGKTHARIRNLTLGETPSGFTYSFTAAGADYVYLRAKNNQQTVLFPVYPADEEGHFEGSVDMPLTYARSLITVQIMNSKKAVLDSDTVRKGWEMPPAPEAQPGRLSGLTICIDPGHQENGRPMKEPLSPGLEGEVFGAGGMAQGKYTLRRETTLTLEIGMVLRDELIRQGANVVVTRTGVDQFVSNLDRCQIAADTDSDMMLRLHCDLQPNKDKRGISIYCPLHSDYAKAVADPAEYRTMGELMLTAMKDAAGYEQTEKTGFVHLTDQFIGNNWAKMPCFLIEMGYMSNVADDLLLAYPLHQQRLAEGMAQGVYEIAVHRGLIAPEEAPAE